MKERKHAEPSGDGSELGISVVRPLPQQGPQARPPEPPIGRAGHGSAGGLWQVARLTGTSADGRSLTVRSGHGACDDGPVVKVLETDESVVLHASVKGARSGPCSAEMLEQKVKVELRQPLAHRVVLDALTAQPVPYGG